MPARSVRLLGLRDSIGTSGCLAWAPVWLLAVPAGRRCCSGAGLGAGWPWSDRAAAGGLVATFVALTMHGWWWPGRQVVVVLPALVLTVAWWLATTTRRGPGAALVVTAAVGLVTWGWLLVELLQRRLAVIFAFELTRNPLYRAWQVVLPDYRRLTPADWLLHGAWIIAVGLLAWAGWRSVSITSLPTTKETSTDDHPMEPAGGRRDADDLVGSGGLR